MIYLDNAATTPIKSEVLDAMMPYLKGDFGNASSAYTIGQVSRKAIEHAREQIASVIGAKPEEIYFTSGGSESNNLALYGTINLVSAIEHPSVKGRAYGRDLNVDEHGFADLEMLKGMLYLDWDTVSIQIANNEIGTIQPVEAIGKICRQYGVRFHTDAVQAFGQVPINVDKMNIDMLSASGHKFGAMKGVGFLYIRKGVKVVPLILGGHQERGLRAGTENVAGIVGMGVAAELANKTMEARMKKEWGLQSLMIKRLTEEIENVKINGAPIGLSPIPGITTIPRANRLPNNISITIDGVNGETLVLLLDNMGICVSAGSACTSDSPEPSYVLKAIGLTDEQALSTIRITLSDTTTEQEVHYTVDAIKKCVERLRGF